MALTFKIYTGCQVVQVWKTDHMYFINLCKTFEINFLGQPVFFA